jgi:hypothetical protein
MAFKQRTLFFLKVGRDSEGMRTGSAAWPYVTNQPVRRKRQSSSSRSPQDKREHVDTMGGTKHIPKTHALSILESPTQIWLFLCGIFL